MTQPAFDVKWKCEQCESVCIGVAEEIPTPCDFCGSEEIVQVPFETPEEGPKEPWKDPSTWVVSGV